jgi:glycosyltransferase involved in cell wall biosynthesis
VGIQIHRSLGTWGKYVRHFFALTEFARPRLVAAGLPAEKISIGANFVPDPGARSGKPSESNQVLFVGRLSVEKGLSIALEAWGRVAPAGLELVVVGDGPERGSLEVMAGPSVKFVGRLERAEVDRRLLRARAAIAPSISYEGQPLGVLEAFAAGTPVLGSDIGGLGETIAPLGDGWQVAAGDPLAWADGLRRLESGSFVDRGGDRARREFEARYSDAAAKQRLETTYLAVQEH